MSRMLASQREEGGDCFYSDNLFLMLYFVVISEETAFVNQNVQIPLNQHASSRFT